MGGGEGVKGGGEGVNGDGREVINCHDTLQKVCVTHTPSVRLTCSWRSLLISATHKSLASLEGVYIQWNGEEGREEIIRTN